MLGGFAFKMVRRKHCGRPPVDLAEFEAFSCGTSSRRWRGVGARVVISGVEERAKTGVTQFFRSCVLFEETLDIVHNSYEPNSYIPLIF